MKVVTYEEWQKNPVPRMMWVSDSADFEDKVKRKVDFVSLADKNKYPVVAEDEVGTFSLYKHCAEIEEPKKRRMTNQEVAWWLLDGIKEGKHREWKGRNDIFVRCFIYSYSENEADTPIKENILIREDNGEWREPLVEVEE